MMRCGRRLYYVGLCVTIGLFGAASTQIFDFSKIGCQYADRKMTCDYGRATYRIRTPSGTGSARSVPVVVIFHDAGGTSADIIDDERLTNAFLEKGYAVLVPDAEPRRNRFIKYVGLRPGLVKGHMRFPEVEFSKVEFSKKRFYVTGTDGSIRTLRSDGDKGWYYYNIDRIYYVDDDVVGKKKNRIKNIYYSDTEWDSDYIGRDEIQALRQMLAHAAENYGTERTPALIAGVGHGGSLVWQFACYAPKLAELYAPIGGAFWRNIPKDCKNGARLLHTHHRTSAFWPLNGADGSKRHYKRTSVFRNLDVLLNTNYCDHSQKTGRKDEGGVSFTVWPKCERGGPIELILTDDPFAFPPWWLDEVLGRIGADDEPEPDDTGEPAETGPVFRRHGEPEDPQDTRPIFKRPGAGTARRFKRVD